MLVVGGMNLTGIAGNVKFDSNWNQGAGTLSFEYPADQLGVFQNGTTVSLTYNDSPVFYGCLMRTESDMDKRRCCCSDQIRYLQANGSLVREVEPLGRFVERAAAQIGDRLRIGTIENTELNLSRHRFDNKPYLDMILQSIAENEQLNGYHYTFYDRFGALTLTDTLNLRLPLVLGDNSLATGFSYTRSIDRDVYNVVKVVPESGAAVVKQDLESVAKWGKLILYQKESGKNAVQLNHAAETLLASKNREVQSLRIDAVGDTRVIGGSGVKVILGSVGISEWAVVKRATHQFGSNYTMSVELELGRFPLWQR